MNFPQKVIKRNGKQEKFLKKKIIVSIKNSVKDAEIRNDDLVFDIAGKVLANLNERYKSGGEISTYDINSIVEKVLAEKGFFNVLKAFIIYREDKKSKRG
jgi:transcriptional regulator NrdR family protein